MHGCSGQIIYVNVPVKYIVCISKYQAVFPSLPPYVPLEDKTRVPIERRKRELIKRNA